MPPKIEIGTIVKVTKTDDEWKKLLAPSAYRVLRHEDTERPFTDNMHDNKKAGVYYCAGCDLPAYSSEHKFDSGTGWPSFWQPIDPRVVESTTDYKLIFPRTEVHCARCEGQADRPALLHQWCGAEVRGVIAHAVGQAAAAM